VRQNKGSILKASVDYIKLLKPEPAKRKEAEEKLARQIEVNKKLQQKIMVSFVVLLLLVALLEFIFLVESILDKRKNSQI